MESTSSVPEDIKGKLKIDWENPINTNSARSTFYHGETEYGTKVIAKAGKDENGWNMLAKEIKFLGKPDNDNDLVRRNLIPNFRIEKNPHGKEILVMRDLKEIGFIENFRELVDGASLPERRLIFVDLMSAVSNLMYKAHLRRYALHDMLGNLGKGIWFKKNTKDGRYDFVFTDFGLVENVSSFDQEVNHKNFFNAKDLLMEEKNNTPSLLPSFFSSLLHIEDDHVVVDDEILNAFGNEGIAKILTRILNGEFEYFHSVSTGVESYPMELWRFFNRLKQQISTDALLIPETDKPKFSLSEFINSLLEGNSALTPSQIQRYAAHFGLNSSDFKQQLADAQKLLEK